MIVLNLSTFDNETNKCIKKIYYKKYISVYVTGNRRLVDHGLGVKSAILNENRSVEEYISKMAPKDELLKRITV